MNRNFFSRVTNALRRQQSKKGWKVIVGCLAVLVGLCTLYSLIMPATALEAACGLTEHQHSEGCYGTKQVLNCGLEEGAVAEDGEEHTHDDSCYENGEVLTCTKTEHVHTEDCYAQEEDEQSAQSATVRKVQAKAQEGTEVLPLAKYVTNVEPSKDEQIKYDKDSGGFHLNFKLSFEIAENEEVDSSAIYVYDLPENISVPDNLMNETFKGSENGKEVFTYQFVKNTDGTYAIWVQFLNSSGIGDTIKGVIEFTGDTVSDVLDTDGNINIVFDEKYNFSIPYNKIIYPDNETANYDICVTKSEGTLDVEAKTLTYEATVSSKKSTPDTITITDTLSLSKQELIFKNVKVTEIEKVTITDEGTDSDERESLSSEYAKELELTYNDPTVSFEFNLPGLKENQKYYITYVYEVESVPVQLSCTADNTITATAVDTGTHEKVWDSDDSSTPLTSGILNKYGEFDSSAEVIVWTLTINAHGENIANQKLTDSMFGEAIGNSVVVKKDGEEVPEHQGYEISREDGKITGITFKAINGNTNNNTYTVTYKTVQKMGFASQTVENTAGFYGTGITVGVDVGYISDKVYKKLVNATKSDENGIFTMEWKVNVNFPAKLIQKGTVFQELARTAEEAANIRYDKNYHWFTGKQIKDLMEEYKKAGIFDPDNESQVYIRACASLNELQNGNPSFDIKLSKLVDNEKYYGVYIRFLEDVYTSYENNELTYFTTGCDANVKVEQTYRNYVFFGSRNAFDDCVRQKNVVKLNSHVKAEDEVIEINDSDGLKNKTLYWYVRVITNPEEYEFLTVTDMLPENVKISGVGIGTTAEESKENLKPLDKDSASIAENVTVNVSGEADSDDGQTVTTVVKDENYAKVQTKFYICYKCEVLDDLLEEKSYTNHVEVKTNKDEVYGTSDNTETIKVNKVTKTGEWNQNSQSVKYSVEINPLGLKLADGNPISLKDELKFRADEESGLKVNLDVDSVKLYEISEDNEKIACTDWKWTYDEIENEDGYVVDTINATNIPNEKKLVLEYAYIVDCEKLPSSDDSKNLDITNTVELLGIKNGTDDSNMNFTWSHSSTSAWASRGSSYTFYKVQNDNYGKRLEGAEFTLYQEGEDEPLKTYITDSEGTFTIVQSKDSAEFQFESDTLYYVTETTAPEGYQLPDDPDKYYFYFSDKEMESLPEGVMSAVNLRESSDRVFVENAQSKEPDEEPVYELVDTGGRGTRMFYIIGGILMLGSGILLITKKRAGSK